MKYLKIILVALLFSIPITAQELIMIYSGDGTTGGTASADTIPSQFTFTDVTDAALSSYNQAYIVVAGCDSARFYPASGDSLKLGALGTYDVSPIWADLGDSVYTGLVASDTNETATHSIIYSSNGTPYDTFSVTTVASEAFTPEDNSPVLNFIFDDDSVVASGSHTIVSFTYNGYAFVDDTADVLGKIIQTDTSAYFGREAGMKELRWTDTGANPFEVGTSNLTVEAWVYYAGNGSSGNIISKGQNNAFWAFALVLSEGVVIPRFSMYNSGQDSSYRLALNTQVDSLEAGWHHIAITIDRPNNYGYMYIDSVLQTTGVEVTGNASLLNFRYLDVSNSEPAQIGSVNLGDLSSARLYLEALTPADIKQIYEYGLANGHR